MSKILSVVFLAVTAALNSLKKKITVNFRKLSQKNYYKKVYCSIGFLNIFQQILNNGLKEIDLLINFVKMNFFTSGF